MHATARDGWSRKSKSADILRLSPVGIKSVLMSRQYFRIWLAEERPSLQSLDRSRNESWRFFRVGPGQVGGPLPNAALGASPRALCVTHHPSHILW